MILAVSLVVALCAPQLRLAPYPVTVGDEVVVQAADGATALPGVAVAVEMPDGALHPAGVTDAAGRLPFVPTRAGRHVFVATIGGVRSLAPLAVLPERRRWPLLLATAPLALLLLWANLRRARDRRGS